MPEAQPAAAPADRNHEARARAGASLNAKWRLDALLGVGGMGAVYAATHRNGSRAALKVLHLEFAREGQIRERFLREGKIANRVDHPAVVRVFDDDLSDAGEPFLVMDLLEGQTFGQLLKARRKLGVEETFRIFEVVLDLLARCHAASIVHRDIKPANVFLAKPDQIKVLDFGIARLRDPKDQVEATRAGIALGTPSFLAPEQAMGIEGIDGRVDLYSVGACIYTALSGKRLHRGQNDTESFMLAATQPAPSLAREAPELPPEIVAFVDKALAFDRGKRFQDAASMRSEMMGLAAALRAGQLGGPKAQRRGVVVRGNETIDDEEDLSPEQRAKAFDAITGIWRQLSVCLAGFRQYGWGHAQSARMLQAAFDEVVSVLGAGEHAVRWDIGPNAFLYDEKPVWVPDRQPLDRIPYQLFADGIRKVELKPGIVLQELRELLAILLMDRGLGAVDDALTALWDRHFEHIAYLAIDSFAEGDAPDKETFHAQCSEIGGKARSFARIDKDWDEGALEGRALRLNVAAALEESGEAAAGIWLDPIARATLGAQINKGQDEWSERFVDAFAEAYLDALGHGDAELLTAALIEWVRDQMSLKSYGAAFRMLRAVGEAFEGRVDAARAGAIGASITKTALPVKMVGNALADFAGDSRPGGRDGPRVVDPDLAAGLDARFALGDDEGSLVGVVCACLDAAPSGELGRVLSAYLRRWRAGREAELGAFLARAGREAALVVLGLLAEDETDAARAAAENAIRNPSVEVKLEGLARLPAAQAERVRDEVQKILGDDSADTRLGALDRIASMKLVAAGPALGLRIKQPSFHALPIEERRRWIEVVFTLNAHRGERLAIELLAERPLLPKEAVEETRELAARALSGASSREALEAALAASKKRWWNSPPVREAAARTAELVAARLGEVVAENGAPPSSRGEETR